MSDMTLGFLVRHAIADDSFFPMRLTLQQWLLSPENSINLEIQIIIFDKPSLMKNREYSMNGKLRIKYDCMLRVFE